MRNKWNDLLSVACADSVKSIWQSLHVNIPRDRTCKPGRASQVCEPEAICMYVCKNFNCYIIGLSQLPFFKVHTFKGTEKLHPTFFIQPAVINMWNWFRCNTVRSSGLSIQKFTALQNINNWPFTPFFDYIIYTN